MKTTVNNYTAKIENGRAIIFVNGEPRYRTMELTPEDVQAFEDSTSNDIANYLRTTDWYVAI